MAIVQENADGVVFTVRVVPRSSRSEFAGIHNNAVKLKITAPPVEGQANAECIRVIAGLFGVKKRQVTIVSGHTGKTKRVSISGITKNDIESVLSRHEETISGAGTG